MIKTIRCFIIFVFWISHVILIATEIFYLIQEVQKQRRKAKNPNFNKKAGVEV